MLTQEIRGIFFQGVRQLRFIKKQSSFDKYHTSKLIKSLQRHRLEQAMEALLLS
jgi:hypothetical protein